MTGVRTLCLLAFIVCADQAMGAPSLEEYGMLPEVSQMVVSPNGGRIACRNTKSDDEDYIVVYALKEQKYVNLFRVDQIDPQYIRFSGDGHLLLVVTPMLKTSQLRGSSATNDITHIRCKGTTDGSGQGSTSTKLNLLHIASWD